MSDYHNYACRKVGFNVFTTTLLYFSLMITFSQTTLRACMETLWSKDELHSHTTFQRAVTGALTVYLQFIDGPEDIVEIGHLSAKDRKKEREKTKKRKLKEAYAIAKMQAQVLAEQQAAEKDNGKTKIQGVTQK